MRPVPPARPPRVNAVRSLSCSRTLRAQPRAHLRTRPQVAELPPLPQRRLLDCILCCFAIAEHSEREMKDVVHERPDELIKGRAITGFRPVDEVDCGLSGHDVQVACRTDHYGCSDRLLLPMKALIAGAGIAGLATGIALRQARCEVEVFERSSELREIGAAVVVWPNGTSALKALGVQPRWREVERLLLCRQDGRILMRPPVGEMQRRYGSGMMVVHRAELHTALLATLDHERIRLKAEVTAFTQDANGVAVNLAGGEIVEGDFLIGADGLRSAVRKALIGDGPPKYQGFTAWRGEIPAGRLPFEAGTGCNWWGRGGEFLAFPLTDGRIYWAGTANAPESTSPDPGRHKQDALDRFRGWDPRVMEILSATDEDSIIRTDIYDRDPLRTWSRGRVTLVGDAAHPMTPSQGQGACQALEDAVALATSLAGTWETQQAFVAYEHRRLRVANRVVRRSRQASRSVQAVNPIACALRNTLVAVMPSRMALMFLDTQFARAPA